jgi:signal transduction histidine kinase
MAHVNGLKGRQKRQPGGEPRRLVLSFEHGGNRRLLQQWLSPDYDVEAPVRRRDWSQALAQGEVCLMDGAAFGRWGSLLRDHRRREGAAMVPLLLFLRPDAALRARRQVGPWDDIVILPTSPFLVRDRLEWLLRCRRQCQQSRRKMDQVRRHLVRQERLHSLAEMASGIAHDFNNTLSVILGYTHMLLKGSEAGPRDWPELGSSLRAIATAAHDATEVVKGLRYLYRPATQQGLQVGVNLNALVHDVIALTRPKWRDQMFQQGGRVRVVRRLRTLPLLRGNETELREVLVNLVFNALDAMPRGGRLRFETLVQRKWVVLTLADTGQGMTADVRKRAVEPFFTTKGDKGTGLGLAMAQAIVRRHGGRLRIVSTPGKGTTIEMKLPRPAPSALPRLPSAGGWPRVDRLRMLVVDAHEGVLQSLQDLLQSQGHHVRTAQAGLDGLDLLQSEAFDVVLLDWAMPELSGERLAAVIKATAPQTSVVMMTGFDSRSSAALRPANVDAVLHKPLKPTSLGQTLALVAAHRRGLPSKPGLPPSLTEDRAPYEVQRNGA